jgi:hypothetical protein
MPVCDVLHSGERYQRTAIAIGMQKSWLSAHARATSHLQRLAGDFVSESVLVSVVEVDRGDFMAAARPMPEVPPVTTAIFSSILRPMICLLAGETNLRWQASFKIEMDEIYLCIIVNCENAV